MNGFKRQAVLLSLLDEMKARGSWCGETHLQKSAYFLSEGLEIPLELEYVLYKHGPFSFELREVLGGMRGNYLIELESRQPYGPSIVVGEPGRALMERFPNTVGQYAQSVKFISEALGSCSVAELERLSTALFAKLEEPRSSLDQRAVRVNDLKPHVAIELARQAVEQVEELLWNYQHMRGFSESTAVT